jgi:5'(3')-deoxyribonucleotidase
MDGTLAVFKPVDQLETLYEKGYFENLKPISTVLQAVKFIIKNNPEIEVNILSAYFIDSKYALDEKHKWLDQNLPEIPRERRVFLPCGADKKNYIPGGIRENDYLLDDYSVNLNLWEPPAKGIKLLNGINHTRGSWSNDRIRYDKSPSEIANNIVNIMKGQEVVMDNKPLQRSEIRDIDNNFYNNLEVER